MSSSSAGGTHPGSNSPLIAGVVVVLLIAFILYPVIVLGHVVDALLAAGVGAVAAMLMQVLPAAAGSDIRRVLTFASLLLIPFLLIMSVLGPNGGQLFLGGFFLVHAARRLIEDVGDTSG